MLRLDVLGSVLLAVVLGGAVGLERELRGKAAGLRTNILICVGSALFTQLGIGLVANGRGPGDPSRIAAQVVTGVGFIGAGTILRARGGVTGLTSAATIWVVAAIGVALGAGAYLEAAGVTLLLLVVLGGLGRLERYLHVRAQTSQLVVELGDDDMTVDDIEEIVRAKGLEIDEVFTELGDEKNRVHVTMRGPKRLHDQARLSVLRMTGTHKLSIDE